MSHSHSQRLRSAAEAAEADAELLREASEQLDALAREIEALLPPLGEQNQDIVSRLLWRAKTDGEQRDVFYKAAGEIQELRQQVRELKLTMLADSVLPVK